MTSLLLDTHAVLWFWWDDSRLSATAKDAIRDPENRTLVSFATPWEVAIKVSRKRLDIGGGFRGFFDQHMVRTFFEWLPTATKHLDLVAEMPFHHSDPFDRLIAAQALTEGLAVAAPTSYSIPTALRVSGSVRMFATVQIDEKFALPREFVDGAPSAK